ncbi:MAG: hypothetical protein ACK5X3_12920 [Pseudomonadota bacterium]|jgi:hypothetical protein
MKLLRAIFRRFGYALIPLDATDRPNVRRAVWRAQYEWAAEQKGIENDDKIDALVKSRVQDPMQAENDRRAFAALVDAVEKDRQP